MAIDEFLLGDAIDPILRIYGWSNPCVSIGYFQGIEEINYQKCMKEGVEVVRRITGGGAVFHNMELTYSFVTKNFPQDIMQSYQQICQIIITALKNLGFDAKFSPLNDITIDGKKVCGNAQTRKQNTLLQHGTILLDVDFDTMFSLLKVPIEKISDKEILDVKNRVMGISKSFDEVADSLKNSVKQIFQCQLVPYNLEKEDLILCRKIAAEKYANEEWTLRR